MLQFITKKNAQFSKEYIVCLLCSKLGHLCHECMDYEPKIQQLNSNKASIIISSRIEDTNDTSTHVISQDTVMINHKITDGLVPIVLVKYPINKYIATKLSNENESADSKNSTIHTTINFVNIYCLKDPIVFKKDPIFINYDNNKLEYTVDFNQDDSKHFANKCMKDCFLKYCGQDTTTASCKVVQLYAQMSLRIRRRPQFNPNFHSKFSQCDHCEENQTTSNNVHQEVDYEQLLNSKNLL